MDKESQTRANRLAAETFLPMMVEAFHDGLKEAGSLSRWLLATLVAVNGAAAISTLSLKMMPVAKLGSASAFLAGILAAIGAGCWSLYSFNRVTAGAGTMVAYWLSVANDAPRVEVLETTMRKNLEQAIGSRGTHLLVLISVVTFLLGCGAAGWGLIAAG